MLINLHEEQFDWIQTLPLNKIAHLLIYFKRARACGFPRLEIVQKECKLANRHWMMCSTTNWLLIRTAYECSSRDTYYEGGGHERCLIRLDEFLTVFNNFKSFGKIILWRLLFYEHIFCGVHLLLRIITMKLEKKLQNHQISMYHTLPHTFGWVLNRFQ